MKIKPWPTVACLVATNRPEWEPFWKYQIEKQNYPELRYFVETGKETIGWKRNQLLYQARRAGIEYAAFFDDDDWSHPNRIRRCMTEFGGSDYVISAVGGVRSYFVNYKNRMCIEYQAPEGIIFNGMVFHIPSMPAAFSVHLHSKEDTEWLGRWQAEWPSYRIVGNSPLHIWMCHETNTTNRINERTFDYALPVGLLIEEDWKYVPQKHANRKAG